MSVFSHVSTISGTAHSDYITALDIAWIGGQAYLFTGSAADGGLSSYSFSTTGISFNDQIGAGANRGTYGISDLDIWTVGGQDILIPSGRADDRLAFHKIDSTAEFDGLSILGADPALIGNIEHSVAMTVQGKTFLVSSQWGQSGFQAFRIRDDLSLEHKKTMADTADTYADDITAMTSAVVDGRSYFFVASGQDAGVTTYWMGQWGNIKERGSVGVEDGLWVSAPNALATATVGGQLFLILGAAGSDSLTVIRVNTWGGLFIESHYIDTLDTRFGNVQAIETFQIGNRSFVIAGGGDDGLSLFELDPGGTLFHIETIADQTDTTLMNIAALTVEVVNGVAVVFAAGSDSGFTQFTIDLGNIANSKVGNDLDNTITGGSKMDLIAGKDGDDILYGNGNDDRLIDGAGVDTLYGGSGADVFVFVDDNRMDVVADFEPGTDRIHLGDFAMLYTFEQLQFTQKSYGVLLTIGNDRFQIISASGTLQIDDLSAGDFIFDF